MHPLNSKFVLSDGLTFGVNGVAPYQMRTKAPRRSKRKDTTLGVCRGRDSDGLKIGAWGLEDQLSAPLSKLIFQSLLAQCLSDTQPILLARKRTASDGRGRLGGSNGSVPTG